MNNIVLLMIDMEPKDAIKLDNIPLDKKNPEETILPKDELCILFLSIQCIRMALRKTLLLD